MLCDSSLRVFIVSKNNNPFIFFSPLSDWKNKWYFNCDTRCLESLVQKDFKVLIQYFSESPQGNVSVLLGWN